MQNIHGRTAIITGGSRGIGAVVAQELARQGLNLALAARSEDELLATAKQLELENNKAIIVPTDVTDVDQAQNLVDRTVDEFGTVDILINNAGIERVFEFHKLAPKDIQRIIEVNLTSALVISRLVLPVMLKQKSGHIVNMASLAGKFRPPHTQPYTSSKAGLIGFTSSLRAEFRHQGVSASVICPGFVGDAGMFHRQKDEASLQPTKLMGTSSAEGVARAVVKAIKKDKPEILINRGPIRIVTTLCEIFPGLPRVICKFAGVSDMLLQGARTREKVEGV